MNTEILTRDSAPTRWVRPLDGAMAQASRLDDASLPVDRLLLWDRSFFEGKSIQELAQSQGVGPVKDISVFAGGIPDDEDVDEMLEEIYRLREP
jgi:hypothetical protein